MNELRLEYHRETGIRINERINYDFGGMTTAVKDYIEWLEGRIEGAKKHMPMFPVHKEGIFYKRNSIKK